VILKGEYVMSEPELDVRRVQVPDFCLDSKPAHYYSEELLVPLSTWRHVKTGSTYTVLGVSTSSTNGPGEGVDKVVIYVSHTHQQLRHRDIAEFLDGRFCPEPRGG
jgi:hypothetical protein